MVSGWTPARVPYRTVGTTAGSGRWIVTTRREQLTVRFRRRGTSSLAPATATVRGVPAVAVDHTDGVLGDRAAGRPTNDLRSRPRSIRARGVSDRRDVARLSGLVADESSWPSSSRTGARRTRAWSTSHTGRFPAADPDRGQTWVRAGRPTGRRIAAGGGLPLDGAWSLRWIDADTGRQGELTPPVPCGKICTCATRSGRRGRGRRGVRARRDARQHLDGRIFIEKRLDDRERQREPEKIAIAIGGRHHRARLHGRELAVGRHFDRHEFAFTVRRQLPASRPSMTR